jgi:hypothetical protein
MTSPDEQMTALGGSPRIQRRRGNNILDTGDEKGYI